MASSATDSQGKDKAIREKLIKTGDVDVMVSVGNNFFYTKSLPCTLWFFDKNKPDQNKDKVLFIDARNYYTVVDRTLNEWSTWQLKNLNAIVWLYRGEVYKYKDLINKYHDALGCDKPFNEQIEVIEDKITKLKEEAKQAVKNAVKKDKKKVQYEYDEKLSSLNNILTIAKEANWLYEKFDNGEYADIPGLCKVTTINEVEDKSWSLTPGAYVGVAPVEDDGVDFHERMKEIHEELLELQNESNELMKIISKNMKEKLLCDVNL